MYRCIGYGLFFFAQIAAFLNQFTDLNNTEIDADEQAAGVENLKVFGVFSTMDALTNGNLLLHEDYWKLPARLVYTKLLYDKKVRDYQRDLSKIKQLNAKQ